MSDSFSFSMSMIAAKVESTSVPVMIKSGERIRQLVDDRHWQLFESRLKAPAPPRWKANYTKSNDYRVVDRLKRVDQPQAPLEPNERWQHFCCQVTSQSNEVTRLTSLFRHVWRTNWHTQQLPDRTRPAKTFLDYLSKDERDRRVISSILHRHV